MSHHCFGPILEGTNSEMPLGNFTLNLVLSYILYSKGTKLLLKPQLNNFVTNASLHLLSYASLISTNERQFFLFLLKYTSIKVLRVSAWSAVLKPFLNPIWLYFKIFWSFTNCPNLLLRWRLKSLQRQVFIVMPR